MYVSKYLEVIWNVGIEGKGVELGNIIFDKIFNSFFGIKVSKYDYSKVWDLMKILDKKVNLYILELLDDWLLKLLEVLEN